MPEKNLIQKEDIFKLSGTVLGGGALLRSVMWSKGTKLSAYIDIYVKCMCKICDSEVTIVLMAIKQKHKKSWKSMQKPNLVPQSSNVKLHPDNKILFR